MDPIGSQLAVVMPSQKQAVELQTPMWQQRAGAAVACAEETGGGVADACAEETGGGVAVACAATGGAVADACAEPCVFLYRGLR